MFVYRRSAMGYDMLFDAPPCMCCSAGLRSCAMYAAVLLCYAVCAVVLCRVVCVVLCVVMCCVMYCLLCIVLRVVLCCVLCCVLYCVMRTESASAYDVSSIQEFARETGSQSAASCICESVSAYTCWLGRGVMCPWRCGHVNDRRVVCEGGEQCSRR